MLGTVTPLRFRMPTSAGKRQKPALRQREGAPRRMPLYPPDSVEPVVPISTMQAVDSL